MAAIFTTPKELMDYAREHGIGVDEDDDDITDQYAAEHGIETDIPGDTELPSVLTDPIGAAREGYEHVVAPIGRQLMKGFSQIDRTADRAAAPFRSAAQSYQRGEGLRQNADAFMRQIPRDPSEAPTYGQIYQGAGIPQPYADYAGEGTGLLLNPLNKVDAAVGGASKISNKVRDYLKGASERRAVKAVTGGGVEDLRKIANVNRANPGSAEKAFDRVERTGRDILEEPDLLGMTETVRSAGPKLTQAREKYGDKIGQIGEKLERFYPKSISGDDIAHDIINYAESIPPTKDGKLLIDRLVQEANETFAGKQFSFAEAQKYKNAFPYKAGAADALTSNQDANNRIIGIISDRMEGAVDDGVRKMNQRFGGSTLDEMQAATNEPKGYWSSVLTTRNANAKDLYKDLKDYPEIKGKYGSFKNLERANTNRQLQDQSNRLASPSDMAIGSTAALMSAGADSSRMRNVATGVLAGAANQFARKSGSAVAARVADRLQKWMSVDTEAARLYGQPLIKAAQMGAVPFMSMHRILLKNPAYAEHFREGDMQ